MRYFKTICLRFWRCEYKGLDFGIRDFTFEKSCKLPKETTGYLKISPVLRTFVVTSRTTTHHNIALSQEERSGYRSYSNPLLSLLVYLMSFS